MSVSDLYKGSLSSIVLQLIEQQGELYGYQLTQMAKEISNGQLTITESTLYPLLHILESEGKLESELKTFGNRVRKYYRLTKKGKKEQKIAFENLQEYIAQLQLFLQPKLN